MTIEIPPEALEAGARAVCQVENGPCDAPDKCDCTYWQAAARAAFTAMIEAWPGMRQQNWTALGRTNVDLILPLPQENKNG